MVSRNAVVSHCAAEAVTRFDDCDTVPRSLQFACGRKAGKPGTNDEGGEDDAYEVIDQRIIHWLLERILKGDLIPDTRKGLFEARRRSFWGWMRSTFPGRAA